MTTKNIEKEFRIEVIASFLENRLLSSIEYQVNENDLYELVTFVSGIDINKNNFYMMGGKVKNILLLLQPELNTRIIITKSDLFPLDEVDKRNIILNYRKKFGDSYKIKSVTKCLVKSLEIQDK